MNKISRRNFLKVAGAGAAAMGLAACGGSSSSSSSVAASSTAANAAADTLSGTIEYWSSWSETENQALVLKQAADAFTQLHPNVKINFTFNGRDNRNLVVSAIEAGTQIDRWMQTLTMFRSCGARTLKTSLLTLIRPTTPPTARHTKMSSFPA